MVFETATPWLHQVVTAPYWQELSSAIIHGCHSLARFKLWSTFLNSLVFIILDILNMVKINVLFSPH